MKADAKEEKTPGLASNGVAPPVIPSVQGRGVDKHVQVLEDNRGLIVQNIIVSQAFYQLVREQKVLPESMLSTVQVSLHTSGTRQYAK